ncbi:MAG: hypothetical protein DDT31_01890 [Syntrophomonadaceae bacterium]|nr:hypothetical protein [Bacillota bacterium]
MVLAHASKIAYFKRLINRVFPLLPMREEGNATINIYLESLISELRGTMDEFQLHSDADFLVLLVTLSSLKPLLLCINATTDVVEHAKLCELWRREVLKCTNIIHSRFIV